MKTKKTGLMPVIFLGHGNPMNALEDNYYSRSWQALHLRIPTPKAILVISAHWETSGSLVQEHPQPRQIYDFRGFPQELFDLKYQPLGNPVIAKVINSLNSKIAPTTSWGLDHGAWAVLCHLFPFAKIPTLQLSIDKNLTPQQHFELAQSLQKLREQNILILGSGNIVHNLRAASWAKDAQAYDWAIDLDETIKSLVLHKNYQGVVDLIKSEPTLMQAGHPSLEHFLPLLYTLGAGLKGEPEVTTEGIDLSSISMTSFFIK